MEKIKFLNFFGKSILKSQSVSNYGEDLFLEVIADNYYVSYDRETNDYKNIVGAGEIYKKRLFKKEDKVFDLYMISGRSLAYKGYFNFMSKDSSYNYVDVDYPVTYDIEVKVNKERSINFVKYFKKYIADNQLNQDYIEKCTKDIVNQVIQKTLYDSCFTSIDEFKSNEEAINRTLLKEFTQNKELNLMGIEVIAISAVVNDDYEHREEVKAVQHNESLKGKTDHNDESLKIDNSGEER